jgi:hypothetical protein
MRRRGLARFTRVAQQRSRVREYVAETRQALGGAFRDGAQRVEAWEKANHRWQNRTGAAERGLTCRVEETATGFRLVNLHGVSYGGVLEFGHEGRFAILQEALRRHWISIMAEAARRGRAVK